MLMIIFNSVTLSFFLLFLSFGYGYSQECTTENKICGFWMSTEKNLVVKVFRQAEDFKAKVIWFRNEDYPDKDINEYKDTSNPNPKLRNRKIVGLDIVEGLTFRKESNSWEKGKIYDPYHGRFWDSSAYITEDGLLKVTGYWKFKWIGKTITFERMNNNVIVGKL